MVSYSPSPSHGTKILIDGLLSRVEPWEWNSRVLLCFIDSDPVYTFHNKYKNIFLVHSNEIFLFDGIYGGIFRNQNFSSYRQNDGFTTKRKNINFP